MPFTILPRMGTAKHELARQFFEAMEAGEVDAAVALTTDDVVIDRRNSNAPWGRAVTTGHEEFREAYRDFRRAAAPGRRSAGFIGSCCELERPAGDGSWSKP